MSIFKMNWKEDKADEGTTMAAMMMITPGFKLYNH